MRIGLIDVDEEKKMRIKEIEGFDGRYTISDTGEVRSVYRFSNIHGVLMRVGKPKLLKPSKDKRGYLIVNLYKGDGKPISKKVHRLVAEAFIENPLNKRCVCHKDNNPENCNVENLYWGTDKENQDQAWRDGLHKSEMPVVQISAEDEVVGIYRSQREASDKTGVGQRNISACIRNKRKYAGGYKWQKLD